MVCEEPTSPCITANSCMGGVCVMSYEPEGSRCGLHLECDGAGACVADGTGRPMAGAFSATGSAQCSQPTVDSLVVHGAGAEGGCVYSDPALLTPPFRLTTTVMVTAFTADGVGRHGGMLFGDSVNAVRGYSTLVPPPAPALPSPAFGSLMLSVFARSSTSAPLPVSCPAPPASHRGNPVTRRRR